MPDDHTLQKRRFTEAIADHGNVRRAMREAGIGSPTTAYRWLADYHAHGPGWYTRDRRRTRAVPPDVAEEVVRWAELHPMLGKDRLTRHIEQLFGPHAISPNGVRNVLREAGLWASQPARAHPEAIDPDRERLVATIQHGLALDLGGHPREAAAVLVAALWQPVRANPLAAAALFQEPVAGTWALRGMVQLAHALIDSGRWRSALHCLSFLDDWLATPGAVPTRRQAAFQDQGRAYPSPAHGRWLVANAETSPAEMAAGESVSLRTDDIWLETQQYLGLVTRNGRGDAAVERLAHAAETIDRGRPRVITPAYRARYQGIISHDLAVAQLQARWPVGAIATSLARSRDAFGETPHTGMTASIWLGTARMHRLAAEREPAQAHLHLERAQAAVDEALALVDAEGSPILRVNVAFKATAILLKQRPPTQEDRERLAHVAAYTVEHGLAHRARSLLEDREVMPLIEDFRAGLEESTRQ